jgi:hypothetical protein
MDAMLETLKVKTVQVDVQQTGGIRMVYTKD